MKITRFAAPLSALALAFAITNAQAAEWQTNYRTTIFDGHPDVRYIIEFVAGDNWSANTPGYLWAYSGETTDIGSTWAFAPSAPTSSFLMGLLDWPVSEMRMQESEPEPDPVPPDTHLVLFTNPDGPGGNGGVAWPFSTPEATLIDAMWNATVYDDPDSWTTLNDFRQSAEVSSSWFATAGGSFNVVAYSTGELIGYGVASVAQVPEPHEWMLMLGGIGVVGWAARRNRARNEAAAPLGCAPA